MGSGSLYDEGEGLVSESKMDAITALNSALDEAILEAHNGMLSFWEILRVFLDYCQRLQTKAEAEYYLKGGA